MWPAKNAVGSDSDQYGLSLARSALLNQGEWRFRRQTVLNKRLTNNIDTA